MHRFRRRSDCQSAFCKHSRLKICFWMKLSPDQDAFAKNMLLFHENEASKFVVSQREKSKL